MQLIVLGMHRSGTSALIRLLGLMGCYIGGEGSFHAADRANPKGYWEHKQVWGFDEEVLAALDASWFDVAGVDCQRLDPERRRAFDEQARRIVAELAPHQPWAIKDPRLCLLLPLWRAVLDRPICLLMHRGPLEIARSLATRDDFPLSFGIALWERYLLDALRHTAGLRRLVVSHRDLIGDPRGTLRRLADELAALGVTGLRVPDDDEITAFIDPALHRARSEPDEEAAYLGSAQAALLASMEDGSALERETRPALSAGAAEMLRWYPRVSAELQELQQELAQATHERDGLARERLGFVEHVESLESHLRMAKEEESLLRDVLSEREQEQQQERERMAGELQRGRRELQTSIGWGSEMERLIQLILESGRWKLGDWTGEAVRRVLLRPRQLRVNEHAGRIVGGFRRWRKEQSDASSADA